MTRILDRSAAAATAPAPTRFRTQLDLAGQQLHAIETFNKARRIAEEAAAATGRSREMRMDNDRRLEVIRRQHQALVERVDLQLRLSGEVLQQRTGRRVVLAHRNAWFVGKLSDLLRDRGMEVVTRVENGAEAVGATLAEQPDLLLVEDKLAMVAGEDVVREIRRYCPDTLVAAQVDYGDRVAALLEAGAHAVFTRQIPPPDIATRLEELLSA